jgi:hypothetical protein
MILAGIVMATVCAKIVTKKHGGIFTVTGAST